MEGVKRGANRQELHELIRECSLMAWAAVQAGQSNPLPRLLGGDERITRYVPEPELMTLLDASGHVGDAPERTRMLAEQIRNALAL